MQYTTIHTPHYKDILHMQLLSLHPTIPFVLGVDDYSYSEKMTYTTRYLEPRANNDYVFKTIR